MPLAEPVAALNPDRKNMTNDEQIAAKAKEVEHYRGVLQRNGHGRWLDMGKRRLAELEEELRVLKNNGELTGLGSDVP